MKSLYHAYQAYERRVTRGEFDISREKDPKPSTPRVPLLIQLGDLLIQTGMKLKARHAARNSISWTPLLGSKS
ncbi:MAG: hypothetical protein ABSG01_06955 [Anaerolineales bacterium]|jgi:hypothetical protein